MLKIFKAIIDAVIIAALIGLPFIIYFAGWTA
jgi:hypothetical protein